MPGKKRTLRKKNIEKKTKRNLRRKTKRNLRGGGGEVPSSAIKVFTFSAKGAKEKERHLYFQWWKGVIEDGKFHRTKTGSYALWAGNASAALTSLVDYLNWSLPIVREELSSIAKSNNGENLAYEVIKRVIQLTMDNEMAETMWGKLWKAFGSDDKKKWKEKYGRDEGKAASENGGLPATMTLSERIASNKRQHMGNKRSLMDVTGDEETTVPVPIPEPCYVKRTDEHGLVTFVKTDTQKPIPRVVVDPYKRLGGKGGWEDRG